MLYTLEITGLNILKMKYKSKRKYYNDPELYAR